MSPNRAPPTTGGGNPPITKRPRIKSLCCFCGLFSQTDQMHEKPEDPWDIGIPLMNDSTLCCGKCDKRNAGQAGFKRRVHGLFAAADLATWPAKAGKEFVFKLLASAERPPVDATGFYPGGSVHSSRPVTRQDIQTDLFVADSVWRADWADVKSAGVTDDAPPAMPCDWTALALDDLPGPELLEEFRAASREGFDDGVLTEDHVRGGGTAPHGNLAVGDMAGFSGLGMDAVTAATPPRTAHTPAMMRKVARKFGLVRGKAPLCVRCDLMEPHKFFFPNHGALVATLVQLVRCSAQAKGWIVEYLPGLCDRAIRCPVRAHTRASKASFYLLCTLASELRQELSSLHLSQRVTWSLVGEENLAASILQLLWKKKRSDALTDVRVTAAAVEAEEEVKKKEAEAEEDQEKGAFGEAAKNSEEQEEEDEKEQGGGDGDAPSTPRNPFEERRKMIVRFHRSHVLETWTKMKDECSRKCADGVRVWCGLAHGLMAADRNGLSDPYVVVKQRRINSKTGRTFLREVFRTRVIEDTLDPVWNESFTLSMHDVGSGITELVFQLMDYDRVGSHDSLGSCSCEFAAERLSVDFTFRTLPVVLKKGQTTTKRGRLHIALCREHGEDPTPVMVSLDMYRGSVKLLALLTKPRSSDLAHRNACHLNLNGGILPVMTGLIGEFGDDDIRIQQLCALLYLHMCIVPENCPRCMPVVQDLLEVIVPGFETTTLVRVYLLRALICLSVPFVAPYDRKDPEIFETALHRATTLCARVLASDAAIAAYIELLCDLTDHASPTLGRLEADLVALILDLFNGIASYDVSPSPAAALLDRIVHVQGQGPGGLEDAASEASSLGASITSAGGPANQLMVALLGLFGETQCGIDVKVMALFQKLLKFNVNKQNVVPVIVAIQGVHEKDLRRGIEHLIENSGAEWREPDFMAANVSDILDDDVTHLFEGDFIKRNGRTRKEAACFTDAVTQGACVLNDMQALKEVLDEHMDALSAATPQVNLHPDAITPHILKACVRLPRCTWPAATGLEEEGEKEGMVSGDERGGEEAEQGSLLRTLLYNEAVFQSMHRKWLRASKPIKCMVSCIHLWVQTLSAADCDVEDHVRRPSSESIDHLPPPPPKAQQQLSPGDEDEAGGAEARDLSKHPEAPFADMFETLHSHSLNSDDTACAHPESLGKVKSCPMLESMVTLALSPGLNSMSFTKRRALSWALSHMHSLPREIQALALHACVDAVDILVSDVNNLAYALRRGTAATGGNSAALPVQEFILSLDTLTDVAWALLRLSSESRSLRSYIQALLCGLDLNRKKSMKNPSGVRNADSSGGQFGPLVKSADRLCAALNVLCAVADLAPEALDCATVWMILLRHLCVALGSGRTEVYPLLAHPQVVQTLTELLTSAPPTLQNHIIHLLHEGLRASPGEMLNALNASDCMRALVEAASPEGLPVDFFALIAACAEFDPDGTVQHIASIPHDASVLAARTYSETTPLRQMKVHFGAHMAKATVLTRCLIDNLLRSKYKPEHIPVCVELLRTMRALAPACKHIFMHHVVLRKVVWLLARTLEGGVFDSGGSGGGDGGDGGGGWENRSVGSLTTDGQGTAVTLTPGEHDEAAEYNALALKRTPLDAPQFDDLGHRCIRVRTTDVRDRRRRFKALFPKGLSKVASKNRAQPRKTCLARPGPARILQEHCVAFLALCLRSGTSPANAAVLMGALEALNDVVSCTRHCEDHMAYALALDALMDVCVLRHGAYHAKLAEVGAGEGGCIEDIAERLAALKEITAVHRSRAPTIKETEDLDMVERLVELASMRPRSL